MNTDRPGSRLPDESAYWQDLAARSIDAAFDSGDADVALHGDGVAEPRNAALVVASPWWRGLSDAAFTLAASALLALVGGALLLDERSPVPAAEVHALTGAIAPDDDDVLTSLMNADEPPPAMAMLRVVARREAAR
ncbi:MAG TPA: hypothetical protein VK912_08685 [Longimicrobiales bacterium]|nr:hypothetical protein [Longimicrobiales bacterium]